MRQAKPALLSVLLLTAAWMNFHGTEPEMSPRLDLRVASGSPAEMDGSGNSYRWITIPQLILTVNNTKTESVRYRAVALLSSDPCGRLPELQSPAGESLSVAQGSVALEISGTLAPQSRRAYRYSIVSAPCRIESDGRFFFGKVDSVVLSEE